MAEAPTEPREPPARLDPSPDAPRVLLHCDPRSSSAVGEALGITLGGAMLRSTASSGWTSLHLAPDEWLLIGRPGGANDLRAPADAPPLSLVEISDRYVGLDLIGAQAAEVLAVTSPVDFALQHFPAGACTRAPLGKTDMTLWRRTPDSFHILVGRSFHPYALALLERALEDCGFR